MQYQIVIPQVKIDEKLLKDLSFQPPSILEEVKQKLGIDFTQYNPYPAKPDAKRTTSQQPQQSRFPTQTLSPEMQTLQVPV